MFLYGFAKSGRANLDDDELDGWRVVARSYRGLNMTGIEAAIDGADLIEVSDDEVE